MKFAKYWSSVEVPVDKSLFFMLRTNDTTVSIWGASNDSKADAIAMAEKRASHFATLISKQDPNFQEYEYWTGFIREEVLEEVYSTDNRKIAVLTRNRYGAVVLNSENVFFGDIDTQEEPLGFFGRLFGKTQRDKAYYLEKIEAYQLANSHHTFKVYETHSGLRVVIINTLFDGQTAEVNEVFKALDTDPLYIRLCEQQSCFRARLTPKPWRINIERPLQGYPRHSREEEAEYSKWLRTYEWASKKHNTVRLLATFGSDEPHSDVQRVMDVHDDYALGDDFELA